jgi:flagellar basal body rod protein FlgG
MIGPMPALNGLQNSAAQFNQAANNVVKATFPAQRGQDTVDLSTAAVAMLQSKNSFDANTKVIKTENSMDQTLMDTLG